MNTTNNSKKTMLYIHGLGSGANSNTPKTLRRLLPDWEIHSPEIPIRPKEACEFLWNEYPFEDLDMVVATSLGGFYALAAFPWVDKLIVNPAMFADEDIFNHIGLGIQPFFSERSDGATEYVIDESFIAELKEIRDKIYSSRDMIHPDRLDINQLNTTYGLFGSKDELLGSYGHYEDFIKIFFPDQAYKFEGGHQLNERVIKEHVLPLIKHIDENR